MTQLQKFNLILKDNGINSFTRGMKAFDQFIKNEDPILLKDAIMFLHHGIELLMKQILINKSEFLIFDDLQDAAKKQKLAHEKNVDIFFLERPPKTITYEEAVSRVDAFISPQELDQKLVQNLVRLNQLRNQLEHYAIDTEVEKVVNLISDILDPLSALFQKRIGGIKQVDTLEIKATSEIMWNIRREASVTEKKVYEILRKFDHQKVPGYLLGVDNEIILPKFSSVSVNTMIHKEGVSSVGYVPDFFCESDQGNWIIEVKAKVMDIEKTKRIISEMRFLSGNPQSWLVIFSVPPDELIRYCKQNKIFITGEHEWKALEEKISSQWKK